MNIIVTGASKGIGKELVVLLSGDPQHNIIAVSRDAKLLRELQEECANPIHVLPFNLTSDAAAYETFFEAVKEKLGHVDILINNAGLLINKPFEALDTNDFNRLFQVNVWAVFALTSKLLSVFSKKSHIVNIGSMGGYQGSAKFKGLSLYSAAKGALAVMTECMAEEFNERQISANCLALGAVQTEMLDTAFPGHKAPLQPEEMASFIADFALNGQRFFNGKIIPVSLTTP